MLKRLSGIFLGLFLITVPIAHAAEENSFTALSDIITNGEESSSIFDTFTSIRNYESTLTKKQVELDYLKENADNEFADQLTAKETELTDKRKRLLEIADERAGISREAEDYQDTINRLKNEEQEVRIAIENLEDEIQQLQLQKEEKDASNLDSVAQLQKEILSIKKEIAKEKEVFWAQFWELLKRAGYFLGFVLLALLFKKIAEKAINNGKRNLTQKRKEVLVRVLNIFTFSLVAIAILAVFFSQFASLLPFLALLGTGLAFAVRDVISSFIAWFFIGTEDGYKVGDLIEIGGARGRVIDIHLIHTIIQETGYKGPSGKVLSMPNKKIFEEKLRNFSKMYRFTWVILDFLLEKDSSVTKAKEILMDVVNETIHEDMEEVRKNLPSLARKFGMSEESVKPHIFIELEEKGIRIKVKFLVRLIHRHSLHSTVSELFLEKIREDDDINLRFLNL